MLSQTCRRLLAVAAGLCLSWSLTFGQMSHKPTASDAHQHLYAIVPMIGLGTVNDPKRPMFTGLPGAKIALPIAGHSTAITAQRTGIIGYHAQISDDGKSALVEFIAPSTTDFKDIVGTADSRVRLFQKGPQTKAEVEAAFRVQKKDFSFEN